MFSKSLLGSGVQNEAQKKKPETQTCQASCHVPGQGKKSSEHSEIVNHKAEAEVVKILRCVVSKKNNQEKHLKKKQRKWTYRCLVVNKTKYDNLLALKGLVYFKN